MRKSNLVFLVALFCACPLTFDKTQENPELADSIPETVLINITLVRVENSEMSVKLDADRVETYKNKNAMQIFDLHYKQFDDGGEVLTEGWADQATYYTDTENAEISGRIHFYSSSEQTGIFAEYLNWNHEAQVLTSRPNEKVTVVRDDGSYVQGYGLTSDFKLKEITFSGRVKGLILDEEE